MTYSFNKNFSTYVDYKINMLDNDEALYDAYGISTRRHRWCGHVSTSSNLKISKAASAAFFS